MAPWLTTKKRGRDDDQIEADRVKALQARKGLKGKSGGRPKAKPAKKKASGRRMSEDDEDSIDDFVVDDDEELSEAEELSESEEEVLLSTSIAAKLKKKEMDSSSEEEGDTFFRSYKKRTSRPPPAMRKHGTRPVGKVAKLPAPTMQKPRQKETVDLYDDESDESEYDRNRVAAPLGKRKHAAKRSDLSSDDESMNLNKGETTPTQKLYTMDSDDDLPSSSKLGQTVAGVGHSRPATSRFFSSGSKPAKTQASDDETPFEPAAIRKPKQRPVVNDDDEDADDGLLDTPIVHKAAKKKSKKKKKLAQFQEDSMDEDEAIALAMAMDASQRESTTPSKAVELLDDESNQVVDMLDDESDDGDEQDEYVTREERAASSILDTANDLSAQVLQAMNKWSSSSDSPAVPTGMIVDGALTLANLSAENSSSDHSWISQEIMKRILPDVTLADYQLIGVNWMALLHGMRCQVDGGKASHTNVNGVLADEMGLGKTVQTIAFLSWLRYSKDPDRKPSAGASGKEAIALDSSDEDESPAKSKPVERAYPHLVVAPAAVLSNWEREFEKFAPHLHVVKYHGTQAERAELQLQLGLYLPGKKIPPAQPLDVILAPITYFQKEKSDDRYFLRKFRYDYMVVDEAHLLKNPRGTRYKSLDRFNTLHRLLLTGTPVQNSPQELMALLCFLMPLFSRKGSGSADDDEIDQVHDGGESMLQHFVSLENGQGHDDQEAYRKLKQLFAPFVLRRRKDDVLSQVMPPKTRQIEFVELEPAERERYNSILMNHLESKKKKEASTTREHLFTNLRKAAHHQLLLRFRHLGPSEKEHMTHYFYQYGAFEGEGSTKERVAEELERYNDFQIHLTALELIDANPHRRPDLERYVLQEEDLFCSAKMVRLRELLTDMIPKGHRITIFSGWTSCLDLLGCLLEQMNLSYLRMEGSTPVHERQALIDRFNTDTSIPIFLLSTRACGLGINLTAADVCIQHDLDFNIFNDLQAEDRIHRIGQTKKVRVIKLVAKDTVDEDIYAMQQRKAKMSAAIMENNASSKKDMEQVLQTAVDRFLKSPSAKIQEKENAGNAIVATVDVDEL